MKFLYYNIFIFLILFNSATESFAQFGDNKSPLKVAVLPPSPEAASLGKFGEIPVSLYTGIPSISIPIIEVKGRRLSIPVSLNYHAGGIRVEEVASRTGLGWALSAGGPITRTVRGLPDDAEGNGWLETPSGPADIAGMTPGNRDLFLRHAVRGEVDVEPDVYNYDFGGMSGKFVMTKAGAISTFPHEKLVVTVVKSSYTIIGFVVKDTNGNKYYFGKSADNARTATDFMETTSTCNDAASASNANYTSSWYLLDVIDNNSEDAIQLEYETYTTTTCNNSTETKYVGSSGATPKNPTICFSSTTLSGSRILYITSSIYNIWFSYGNNRLDYPGDKQLALITVRDPSTNIYLKRFYFNYSYFTSSINSTSNPYCGNLTSDARTKRLKLLSIQEKSGDGTLAVPPYVFSYNDAFNLPERFSYQQDYWGYFNSASQNEVAATMVPAAHFNTGVEAYLPGANRSVDTLASQAAILTKIKYPTGGSSIFEYESNTAENGLIPYPIKKTFSPTLVGDGSTTYFLSSGFTVNMLTENGTFFTPNVINVGCALNQLTCNIQFNIKGVTNPSFSQNITSNSTKIFLLNGTYKLEVIITSISNDNKYFGFNGSWDAEIPLAYKPAGGVRIKRITSNDSTGGLPVVKRYKYHFNGSTSGRVNSFIGFKYNYYETNPMGTFLYYAFSSISKATLATTMGSYVAYSHVSELQGENGENGKMEYFYSNPGTSTPTLTYPYPPPFDNGWQQGLLQQKITFKKNGAAFYKIATEVTNYNDYIPTAADIDVFGAVVDGALSTNFPTYILYSNQSGKMLAASTTSTSYSYSSDNSVVDSMTTVTSNYYDNPSHLQLTRSQLIDSKSKTHLLNHKYIQDLSFSSLGTEMISRNMIALPQETTHTVDGLVISGLRQEYSLDSAKVRLRNIYEPEIIAPPAVTWVLKGTYNKYDPKGNTLEIQLKNNITTSYRWGFNNTLPLAELKNGGAVNFFYEGFEESYTISTVFKVGAHANQGSYSKTINNLIAGQYVLTWWEKSAGSGWVFQKQNVAVAGTSYTLPFGSKPSDFLLDEVRFYPLGSELTTYTYNRANLTTSVTDPNGKTIFYDYDALNRMILLRDDKGKVLKHYMYHYKNQ